MMAGKSFLLFATSAALAVSNVLAADIITIKQAEKTIIHTGEVVRVEADGVGFKIQIGEIKLFKADIKEVQIDQPAAIEKAVKELRDHQYQAAVGDLKQFVDRYAGMPLGPDWIEESVGNLGDAYVGLKQLDEAQRVYDLYAKFYPAAIGPKVKIFKIKAERAQCADISGPLKEFLGVYLKKESLSDDMEPAVAEALIVQGDCLRASNKLEDALDSYLLAVTVYNLDEDRASQAKFKAAQVFEQMGNWNRARGSYEELQTEKQGTEVAAVAKQRLEALNKAHPK